MLTSLHEDRNHLHRPAHPLADLSSRACSKRVHDPWWRHGGLESSPNCPLPSLPPFLLQEPPPGVVHRGHRAVPMETAAGRSRGWRGLRNKRSEPLRVEFPRIWGPIPQSGTQEVLNKCLLEGEMRVSQGVSRPECIWTETINFLVRQIQGQLFLLCSLKFIGESRTWKSQDEALSALTKCQAAV